MRLSGSSSGDEKERERERVCVGPYHCLKSDNSSEAFPDAASVTKKKGEKEYAYSQFKFESCFGAGGRLQR